MQEYIRNHPKITALLFIIIVIFIGVVIVVAANNGDSQPARETAGVDTTQEATSYFPYGNSLYSVTYNKTSLKDIPADHNIYIEAFQGYRNAAVNALYDKGLSPADYKITFNYESPFSRYEQN